MGRGIWYLSDMEKKQETGRRIRARRLFLGLDQKELCEKIPGLSVSSLSNYERGYRMPALPIIKKLAVALGVSAGYILLLEDEPLRSNISEADDIKGSVPVISWVQAGNYSEAIDLLQPGEGERVKTTVAVRRYTFALRVNGDSMEPTFPEGAIIIVEPEMQYDSGDFVVIRNGESEATFKQIIKDGNDWFLKPVNPRYPIRPMPKGAVVCGVVRALEMKFK